MSRAAVCLSWATLEAGGSGARIVMCRVDPLHRCARRDPNAQTEDREKEIFFRPNLLHTGWV